jgi:hypothetical protein
VDSRGYRARLQSDNIWEECTCGPWLATEVMVKNPSGDADSSRQRQCGFDWINGDHLQRTMAWVQENTVGDYSQREDGKNALVVGEGSDGENPLRGDGDSRRQCVREDRLWIPERRTIQCEQLTRHELKNL